MSYNMGRISDVNKRRKLEYAQAILLGCTFRKQRIGDYWGRGRRQHVPGGNQWHDGWFKDMPAWHEGNFVHGPFETRHAAVTSALELLGVKAPDARRGVTATVTNFPATN